MKATKFKRRDCVCCVLLMNRCCICLAIAVFTSLTVICVVLATALPLLAFFEECEFRDGQLCLKDTSRCPEDRECYCSRDGEEYDEEFGDWTCRAAETNWQTENGQRVGVACSTLASVFLVASILSCFCCCCADNRDEERDVVTVPAMKSSRLENEIVQLNPQSTA